jgi:hypothetical protein
MLSGPSCSWLLQALLPTLLLLPSVCCGGWRRVSTIGTAVGGLKTCRKSSTVQC